MYREVELPLSVSHCTTNAYMHYGYRCTLCRAALASYRKARPARAPQKRTTYMREYMRKYRARKREERG
jgi:hypothetical protein